MPLNIPVLDAAESKALLANVAPKELFDVYCDYRVTCTAKSWEMKELPT